MSVDPRHTWMLLADCLAFCRAEPMLGSSKETEPSMARLYSTPTPPMDAFQKSIVADNNTVLGAPNARLESNGMPQYALLVTLFTLALRASGRPATVVL